MKISDSSINTKYWVELGIIQDSNQLESKDEHERYRLLISFLEKNKELDERILEILLQLIETDEDIESSAYLYLLEVSDLSQTQFDYVSEKFKNIGDWAKEKLELIQLQRMFDKGNIITEEIKVLIKQQKPKIQHIILDNSISNIEILKLLAEQSQFVKIRKRSKHYLSRKKL